VVRNGRARSPEVVCGTGTIEDEKETPLAFFDFPAEHWAHLRTIDPIEPTFAPVGARTYLARGQGSKKAAVAMIRLLEAAEEGWRRINAPISGSVGTGAEFVNGGLVGGSEERDAA
jgi:putative transposase